MEIILLMKKNNLAIITARSGSKGLKDKNIKLLNGKPLIWYSINAAKEAEIFSEIMVSTDSEKYAEIAKECGASVPFLRSRANSADGSSSWDTVKEVLKKYKEMDREFDTICLLQPTSPLRTGKDIADAYQLFNRKNATTVMGVCEADHSPLWENLLDDSLAMDHFSETDKGDLRQQLDTYYRVNGAIFIVRADYDINNENMYVNSYAHIMPRERSIDIDTELDFMLAEFIITQKR